MDVTIETRTGETLIAMEIGYFDTMLEIKEKIEKYRGIPTSRQTLLFNGEELRDEDNVFDYGKILHNSCILLIDSAELDSIMINPDENGSPHFKNTTLRLLLKLPTSNGLVSVVIADANDRVEQLKEKMHGIEDEAWRSMFPRTIPTERLVLHVDGGIELQDQRHLREYELTDGSEIDVSIREDPEKLQVFVLSRCETKKIKVEVNPSDEVQVLRHELEKSQQRSEFVLPDEGYFFIHRQSVMEEKETFQWHNCRQGDLVEVFNGWITEGFGVGREGKLVEERRRKKTT